MDSNRQDQPPLQVIRSFDDLDSQSDNVSNQAEYKDDQTTISNYVNLEIDNKMQNIINSYLKDNKMAPSSKQKKPDDKDLDQQSYEFMASLFD